MVGTFKRQGHEHMSKKAERQAERDEAAAELRKLLKPGDTVYTILRHRAASGMFRVIDLVIIARRTDLVYPKLPLQPGETYQRTDWEAQPKRVYSGHVPMSIGHRAARAMDDKW